LTVLISIGGARKHGRNDVQNNTKHSASQFDNFTPASASLSNNEYHTTRQVAPGSKHATEQSLPLRNKKKTYKISPLDHWPAIAVQYKCITARAQSSYQLLPPYKLQSSWVTCTCRSITVTWLDLAGARIVNTRSMDNIHSLASAALARNESKTNLDEVAIPKT
jgi:hypothetical protein